MQDKLGKKVSVTTKTESYEGILMPTEDDNSIFIKLDNGYNIGISKNKILKIDVLGDIEKKEKKSHQINQDKNLPKISILHTGGTIASQVDYLTGGVISRFSPEELLSLFPELGTIANIDAELVSQMFSDDMEPEHWKILAEKVKEKYEEGAKGVIIGQGTDNLGYTACALSFMLKDCPIPVLLVGAQRSSDRGSSDAYLNLFCASKFIANSGFKGVAVCMHETSSDDTCSIHPGFSVRKMHTSRRDAFKTINRQPIAKVSEKNIEFLEDLADSDEEKTKGRIEEKNKFEIKTNMEKKVGLLKITPNFDPEILDFYLNNRYKGLVIEGTGLGHAPINDMDEFTKHHAETLKKLENMSKKMIIIMSSQCIHGQVNMNVYSTGRKLLKAGIIPSNNMTPETSFIKLMFLLGNYTIEESKEKFLENLRGEVHEKITANYLR